MSARTSGVCILLLHGRAEWYLSEMTVGIRL